MIETQTRWKRHEKKHVPTDDRTPKQISSDERKNVFQRHAEKATTVDDARSEMSRSQRMTSARERSSEASRNRFGDSQQAAVDPRDKPLRERVWGEPTNVQRGGTGRVLDPETQRLRDEMRNDPKVSDAAAGRALTEKPARLIKVIPTDEEIIAYCNFVIMSHPEVPLDESVRPGDARWYQAVLTNVTNLKRCWFWLVKQSKGGLDLPTLLTAYQVCVDNNCFDYCKPRVRGEGAPLINIVDEVEAPTAGESDELAVLRANIKAGRARTERMRNATPEEAAEIKRLKAMPFDQLRQVVGSNYQK